MMALITVFTPTYNRAYTLPQLYQSLCRQTCKDFVWSIVDDGSSDNTEDVVHQWTDEGRIEICYTKQTNGGKMRAHNHGVRLCSTPLFVCVDSDDFVTDTFVEEIKSYWPQIQSDKKLAGIIAYKSIKNEQGEYRVTCTFPCQGRSSLGDLYNSGFYGDTTLVFKTAVIKQHPFLEVEGEKFSKECYAYDQIDQVYQYLLVEKAWTLCTYMPDGYTQVERNLFKNNPHGMALVYNQKAKFTPGYINKKKLGFAVLYMIFARRAGIKNIYQQSELKTPLYPLFYLLSYYYEWKWKEKYPK
jgi:glycosyltransferase involved in cell wall biosynthesis